MVMMVFPAAAVRSTGFTALLLRDAQTTLVADVAAVARAERGSREGDALARRRCIEGVPSAAVLAQTSAFLAVLAQGVRIDRPPPGTLRRGWIGLDSPRAPTLLVALTVTLVVALIAVAIVRRIRKR